MIFYGFLLVGVIFDLWLSVIIVFLLNVGGYGVEVVWVVIFLVLKG